MGLLESRRTFSAICQALFILGNMPDDTEGARRGLRWEFQIESLLEFRGYPMERSSGGFRIFGVAAASGLQHQVDAAFDCVDAHVIGEWKAYRGPVPKNEVLRFKAASDDLYEELVNLRPRLPVMRLFGIRGDASRDLRLYSARHGIALVERSRWPAPVLADPGFLWPDSYGPTLTHRRRLACLFRPMQQIYARMADGSLRLSRPLPRESADALLHLQDYWSGQLWEVIETSLPDKQEQFLGVAP